MYSADASLSVLFRHHTGYVNMSRTILQNAVSERNALSAFGTCYFLLLFACLCLAGGWCSKCPSAYFYIVPGYRPPMEARTCSRGKAPPLCHLQAGTFTVNEPVYCLPAARFCPHGSSTETAVRGDRLYLCRGSRGCPRPAWWTSLANECVRNRM